MSYMCTVKQGDLLTEEDATFIVNASNMRLVLGSGVSRAFREHCAKALQDEMLESLENMRKPLRQGDVIATSPGAALNFKYALHAAIMNYDADTNYDDSHRHWTSSREA
ncbi:MAG: macro domain-containing protein [Sulfurimonadaceae bacterium]